MHNAGCGDVVGVNVLVADSRQMRNQKECEERSGSVKSIDKDKFIINIKLLFSLKPSSYF